MSEPRAKKRKTAPTVEAAPIIDARFANIQSDPRYRLPSKKHKVKLDKRFSSALTAETDFTRRAKVDRYGRPLETDFERRRLKRKYDLDENVEDSDESDEADDDGEVQKELKRLKPAPRDILREGLNSDDSSSSESSSEGDDYSDSEIEEADLAPQIKEEVPTGEVTSRLACVNLDWDNIHARDLMAVFSSPGFLPQGGRLLSVSIYPSEFGKERMAREEMEGPPAEIFKTSTKQSDQESASDSDTEIKETIVAPDDGTLDFSPTALRTYQLARLRYYYAVLTFSSPSIAHAIYTLIDSTEYLSSANFFDLRFVPDEVTFDDPPYDECNGVEEGYRPTEFVTDALQHSKVKLTWDAEDQGRKEAQMRAFGVGKLKGKGRRGVLEAEEENDLKAYLGTDSSDQESEVEKAAAVGANGVSKKETERQKMRSLLGLPAEPVSKSASKSKSKGEKAPVGDIQITFSAGLNPNDTSDANGNKRSVFENSPDPDETTAERYMRKERERKQKRKDRAKANRDGVAVVEDAAGANDEAEQIESGGKQGEDVDVDMGFDDPFFAERSLNKSASNKVRKEERMKKKVEKEAQEAKERKERAELELLMRDEADSESDNAGFVREKTTTSKSKSKNKESRHFDMREIEKAEKAAKKEARRKNNKDRKGPKVNDEATGNLDPSATDAQIDAVDVDTTDARFNRVHEEHEFAIDPTHSGYKGTKVMEALLEEGRSRKKSRRERRAERSADLSIKEERKGNGAARAGAGADEVNELVANIKKRKA